MKPDKIDSASRHERYSELKNSQLLSLIEKGDEHVTGFIYEKYWKALYISAFKILKNEKESRTIVKDVFTTLFKHGGDQKTGDDIGVYLHAAVRHQVLCRISDSKLYHHLLESLSNYVQDVKKQTDSSRSATVMPIVKLSY